MESKSRVGFSPRAVLLFMLLAGCASVDPVRVTTAEGARIKFGSHFYSYGCFGAVIAADGSTSFILSQEGTSDWASLRALAAILPDVVAATVAFLGAPFELVASLLGVERPPMASPTEMTPCAFLFEVAAEEGTEITDWFEEHEVEAIPDPLLDP